VWGAFLAAGIGEILHCQKSFNAVEYRRTLQNGLFPQIKRGKILILKKMLQPKWQRQPRSGLKTSPSGSCLTWLES